MLRQSWLQPTPLRIPLHYVGSGYGKCLFTISLALGYLNSLDFLCDSWYSYLNQLVGREVQADCPPYRYLVRWLHLDGVLGASLELGRNEGLAEGTAQLRHIFLSYQLFNENGCHRDAWIHSERNFKKGSNWNAKPQKGPQRRMISPQNKHYTFSSFVLIIKTTLHPTIQRFEINLFIF